jgi:hypothetical protein
VGATIAGRQLACRIHCQQIITVHAYRKRWGPGVARPVQSSSVMLHNLAAAALPSRLPLRHVCAHRPRPTCFILRHNHDISGLTLLATFGRLQVQAPCPLLLPSAQTANILSSVRHRIAVMISFYSMS